MQRTLILLCCAFLAADTLQVGSQGFDSEYPAMGPFGFKPRPYVDTPEDTRSISPQGPREAQLVCVAEAPVNRVVLCDIVTWDLCGNIDGAVGNVSQWEISVQSMHSTHFSELVSRVWFLKQGIARFHFTPVEVGVHRVSVRRRRGSLMMPLTTTSTMSVLVVIHDESAKCTTPRTIAHLPQQLRDVLWAQASYWNELQPPPGDEAHRPASPTRVTVDYEVKYDGVSASLQQFSGRRSLEPRIMQALGNMLPGDNNNFAFCDFVSQTSVSGLH